eukprot:TRINITY_DN6198_c0_g1_i1.p1 TRINITY_DN6198_c0_g1~~TRINITY_DN6198_c0_g1_i1.p1  ORF type:complete len:211 (+),score=41.78 TRINITY_DN6198_c0_g1_i1:153-785(+)
MTTAPTVPQEVAFSADVLKELEDFSQQTDKQRNESLTTKVLIGISRTGLVCYPWSLVSDLIAFELSSAMTGFPQRDDNVERSDQVQTTIEQAFAVFTEEPPFTVQRIAELLLEPARYYKTFHKLSLALEKLVVVNTTQAVLDETSYTDAVASQLKDQEEIRAQAIIKNPHLAPPTPALSLTSEDEGDAVPMESTSTDEESAASATPMDTS